MSCSELKAKWPHLTDKELLILSDPNSRYLSATYNLTKPTIEHFFNSLPWAKAVVTPDAYYFRDE